MAVPMTKLKKYLMERINNEDITAVEMVERYLDIMKVFREAQKSVAKEGAQIIVKNGNQGYIKSHPLISDMKNLNAQLLNLKKDIDKHILEHERSKPKEVVKKEGLL